MRRYPYIYGSESNPTELMLEVIVRPTKSQPSLLPHSPGRPAPDAACDLPASGPAGLNCAGFGSIVTVTACVGMFAAARAINALAAEQ